MVLDSLLAGVMLFGSFAARTPNVQPNPDDYEISVGLNHKNFHINRQWERELGQPYVDDLVWLKLDNQIYFKPEYMNKQSRDVKYLKIDWRNKWKDWSYGFTSRNTDENVFSTNFVTFISFGMSKKKKYLNDKIEVEVTFDGYFPPGEEEDRDTFEFEDKFKVSWKLTDKIRIYNLGEISKLQGKEFYKAKIGFEYSF
tara:strand:+ start:765 stop:1358 length:594 start_codon:yes stop_codon:yes gene_type:complete